MADIYERRNNVLTSWKNAKTNRAKALASGVAEAEVFMTRFKERIRYFSAFLSQDFKLDKDLREMRQGVLKEMATLEEEVLSELSTENAQIAKVDTVENAERVVDATGIVSTSPPQQDLLPEAVGGIDLDPSRFGIKAEGNAQEAFAEIPAADAVRLQGLIPQILFIGPADGFLKRFDIK
jgi:hypothetical protein